MIINPSRVSKVIIQNYLDDGTTLPGEPALVISNCNDVIVIESEGGSISVNHNTVPELIKVLREYKAPPNKR